jgi:hypothetical protein
MCFFFSFQKGFLRGDGEGLAILKGWETKFDSFYINSIYLITNLETINFISNYFYEN